MFSCNDVTDPDIRKKLDNISQIKSLKGVPICLPNIHRKKGLESPPQFVAATCGTIVPMLSAPSMNCGMSIFKTSLREEQFSKEFLENFAASLREQVRPRLSRWKMALSWLGLHKRKFLRYDLSRQELEEVFIDGARAAVKKYHLDESELDNIEYGGCVLGYEEKQNINFKKLIPRSAYINGRHEFGYNFGGNHFLEIQKVENIMDPERAEKWGLKKGNILFFYHGGGGHATYHLGRYYASRQKNTSAEKAWLFFLKLWFHLGSPDALRDFHARWKAYFSSKPFPEIPIASGEGQRLFLSIKMALNYGYAFRVALLKRMRDALPGIRISFLWDASHNSIIEESPNIVHRQDAMRIFPGKPVMIAGSNNTLSFLGIASSRGAKTLWSLTPSAAKNIERFTREGNTHEEPHLTYVSKRKEPKLIEIKHISSEGIYDIVEKFEKEDIIKPVAWLRPLASIKGH